MRGATLAVAAKPRRLTPRLSLRHPPSASSLARAAAMATYNPPGDASWPSPSAPGDKLICHQATGQAAQFTRGALSRADLDPASPLAQFHAWFAEAQADPGVSQPEACTLSTAELPSGRVSSRLVYLKELEAERRPQDQDHQRQNQDRDQQQQQQQAPGFVIYSNWGTSRKAADIASNPHAALVFHWAPLQRQVRVEGRAVRCPRAQSQAYFDTRVRGSRIGAWASRQSQVLEPRGGGGDDDGRAQLDEWVAETEKRFEGQDHIPVPDFWGGLRIVPTLVEFWQGRDSRLHDRFVYEWIQGQGDDGHWKLSRLSP